MVRAKDPFWVYVDQPKGKKIGAGFMCKFCREEFSGGATRIKFHLSKETGGDIKSCAKVPEHVSLKATESIRDLKKMKKLTTDTQVQTRSSNTRHGNQDDQPSVDAKLTSFLLLNNIPFDAVEKFVRSVVKTGTDYNLPSTSMLRSPDWIYDTAVVEQVEEHTRDVQNCLVKTGYTLIANKVKMVRGTAMVIYQWTPNGLLFKAKFQGEGEYGFIADYLRDKLSSTIKSLEPTHIVRCICDDDLYSSVGIRKEVFPHYTVEYTGNHAMDIIVEILVAIRLTSLDVTKCASMIFLYMNNNRSMNVTLGKEHERGKESHVSSSRIVMSDMMMTTSSKELADLVVSFSRLKSLLEAEDAVRASQVCIISQLSEQSSEAKYARFVYLTIHCEEFWRRAKHLVQVLQPLFQAFCLVACHGGTIGYLYQAMTRAFLKHNIYDSSKELYHRTFSLMHKAAALLDPAYMLEGNLDEKEIDEIRSYISDGMVEDRDEEGFRKEFDYYCSKNSDLFTSSALGMLTTLHPGEWWELFGHYVPLLQKYALKIVFQPCSSKFFTDDELRSIIRDETAGQFRTKKLMMDRSSMLEAHLEGSTDLDCQLTELYDFARQEGTYLPKYDFILGQISKIGEDFWNASQDPSFQLLDKLPYFLYITDSNV